MKLYTDPEASTELADNVLTTTHNGFTGGHDVFSVYLKKDDDGHTYEDVVVSLGIDAACAVIECWSGKAYLGSDELSEEEWDELSDSVQIGQVANLNIRQIQFRVYIPAGQQSEYYKDKVSISVTAIKVEPNND